MLLQAIYTFTDGSTINNRFIVTNENIKGKEALNKTLTEILIWDEISKLDHVSCCIIASEENFEVPAWYEIRNGQMYYEQGVCIS